MLYGCFDCLCSWLLCYHGDVWSMCVELSEAVTTLSAIVVGQICSGEVLEVD